jgi:uncharacterized membrane protein YhaH (DUF805 family)
MTFNQLLFSLEGRISRSTYWKFSISLIIIAIVIGLIDGATGAHYTIVTIFSLISFWPSLAVSLKRLHDRNKSAWWLFLALIPIVGIIWVFIELGCLKGTAGENRFGPDPLVS